MRQPRAQGLVLEASELRPQHRRKRLLGMHVGAQLVYNAIEPSHQLIPGPLLEPPRRNVTPRGGPVGGVTPAAAAGTHAAAPILEVALVNTHVGPVALGALVEVLAAFERQVCLPVWWPRHQTAPRQSHGTRQSGLEAP